MIMPLKVLTLCICHEVSHSRVFF
uniref:Uncharacterized protein n=1 Tax=Arundo donax TaxID=35708 RepID=A0A0A9BU65_ARUDO